VKRATDRLRRKRVDRLAVEGTINRFDPDAPKQSHALMLYKIEQASKKDPMMPALLSIVTTKDPANIRAFDLAENSGEGSYAGKQTRKKPIFQSDKLPRQRGNAFNFNGERE
jgi:hypothetical protein